MAQQPYSKKVMELFLNPHNMGKIEDADGIGEVGNPVCLVPDARIHFNGEIKRIKEAAEGSFVLSHKGVYNKITLVHKRKHKGKAIEFKNKLGKTTMTPEHLVFAIKIPKKDKFFRTKNKKKLTPAWYHAEDLEKRDTALYPILKKEKDLKEIKIKVDKPKYDFKSFELPKKVKVDKNFMRLAGYFIAEGHANKKKSNHHISFTFHINEKDYYNDVIRIVRKKFNLEPKLKLKPKRNTAMVIVYSAPLTRFFSELFGTNAKNKKIPHFMLLLPIEKQEELVKGLWRGDGYVNVNREYPRAGYSTISYELVNQIKTILLRMKIVPSIYQEEERISKGVKHQKAYRIHIGDKDSLRKLCNILGIKMNYNKYETKHSWFDDDYFYTPITGVKKTNYNGWVYNLEVKDAHSFTTNAFCVHNCGDIMKVYIKVGKNDKGEEVIKDVKFQTWGCAAAIATSSMITDLAKGKTLEEAMKITNKDVAEELGGLPPIKMHCSNLAADALHAAIKDYFEKKKKGVECNG